MVGSGGGYGSQSNVRGSNLKRIDQPKAGGLSFLFL